MKAPRILRLSGKASVHPDIEITEFHGPSHLCDRRGWLVRTTGSHGGGGWPPIDWREAFRHLQRIDPALPLDRVRERTVPDRSEGSWCPAHVVACLAEALLEVFPLEMRSLPSEDAATIQGIFVCCLQHDLAGRALILARGMALVSGVVRVAGMQTSREAEGSLSQALAAFRLMRDTCHHASTNGQLQVAHARGIPIWLIDPSWRLYQLGTGSHSRWISGTCSDQDPYLATQICRDKLRARHLLAGLGIHVPRHVVVPSGVDPEAAIQTAIRTIGYPLVVKPIDSDLGRGVSLALRNVEQLRAAVEKARPHCREGILIEEEVAGHYCRLNMINGEIVAAFQCDIPYVIGDGESSIAVLIEAVQNRQRDGDPSVRADRGLVIDDLTHATLRERGRSIEDVPARNERVVVRQDLTDKSDWFVRVVMESLHPSIRHLSQRVACAVGIPVLGIDYITRDVTQDFEATRGVVLELNSTPLMHPDYGKVLLDALFSPEKGACAPADLLVALGDGADLAAVRLPSRLEWKGETVVVAPQRLKPLARAVEGLATGMQQSLPCLFYSHPREVLTDRSIRRYLFLIDEVEIFQRGLPVATAERIMVLRSKRVRMDPRLPPILEGMNCPWNDLD